MARFRKWLRLFACTVLDRHQDEGGAYRDPPVYFANQRIFETGNRCKVCDRFIKTRPEPGPVSFFYKDADGPAKAIPATRHDDFTTTFEAVRDGRMDGQFPTMSPKERKTITEPLAQHVSDAEAEAARQAFNEWFKTPSIADKSALTEAELDRIAKEDPPPPLPIPPPESRYDRTT